MSKKNKNKKKNVLPTFELNENEKILKWKSSEQINYGYIKFHNVFVTDTFSDLRKNETFLYVLINTNCKLPYVIFAKNRNCNMKKFYINDFIVYKLIGFHPSYKK